MNHDVNTRRS